MDRLEKGTTGSSHIKVTFAEVTMAAKALEARHLSGPTASLALAEALVTVALLSSDLGEADAAMMMRVNLSGPLKALLVEATGDGGLRGFTHQKILNDYDADLPISSSGALGDSGAVQIVSSMPGRVLNQAVLNVNPPLMKFILARYYNQSLQVPTGCFLHVAADTGGVITASGFTLQRMVDSDPDVFVEMLEAIEAGRVASAIGEASQASRETAALMGAVFPGVEFDFPERRELQFKCRCSKAKVLKMLNTLSPNELKQMIDAKESQDVTCHMCGHTYTADTADLMQIADQQADE